MPEHKKFTVPAGFTLIQSLKLLYLIVTNQLHNISLQSDELGKKNDIDSLAKVPKRLNKLLEYMANGIHDIEFHFGCRELLHTNAVSFRDVDLKNSVEDVKLLEQDIRDYRNNIKGSIISYRKQHSKSFALGQKLQLHGIWNNKKTKQRNEEESRAMAEANKIRVTRKREEQERLKQQQEYERAVEAQKSKLMEDKVKRQVEDQVAKKLAEERDRLQNKAINARQQRVTARTSLEKHTLPVTTPRSSKDFEVAQGTRRGQLSTKLSSKAEINTRTSLEENNVSAAARLAWAHSTGVESTGKAPIKVSSSPALSQQVPKKKFEYQKPVVRRTAVKSPSQASKDNVQSTITNAKKVARNKSQAKTQKPLGKPSRSSPSLVTMTSTEDPASEGNLSYDKRIAKVMQNLHGVDPACCEQIVNEILICGEKVQWHDISGLTAAKNYLKETVEYPFLRPDLFRGLREPVRGMLLFGPPGTGKTMLAKAVAYESRSTFFSISASSLLSKYMGESEKMVRALFYLARKLAPSIIFIDEIDSLLSNRSENEHESSRRIKTELLIQWSILSNATIHQSTTVNKDNDREGSVEDTIEENRVLVLGATNTPWMIDDAARRRFTRRLYIPLPGFETRLYHLKRLMRHQHNILTEEDFTSLAEITDGYSGSDLTSLAKEAAMEPIRELGERLINAQAEKIRPICYADFIRATESIKKSVSADSLTKYEEWSIKFGSAGA